mgnify:CR=1 FL=1
MIKSISIILPLYNEAKRLKKTFSEIDKFSKKKTIKFKEFIFVDDGSLDESYLMIKKFIQKKKNQNFPNFNYINLIKIWAKVLQ